MEFTHLITAHHKEWLLRMESGHHQLNTVCPASHCSPSETAFIFSKALWADLNGEKATSLTTVRNLPRLSTLSSTCKRPSIFTWMVGSRPHHAEQSRAERDQGLLPRLGPQVLLGGGGERE